MQRLRQIVEGSETAAGRAFDLSVQILIVLSLVQFSIETLPGLTPGQRAVLGVTEAVTVILFTIEYLLRLLVSQRRLGFIFSFYGLIDLLAILPFYLALGVDLRSVRIFRLFRLVRVLKLFRYGKAINRFRRSFRMIREELILFFMASMFLFFIAAVGIYYCEREAQPKTFGSIFHCMWWAVATLTTVGYGDVFPITPWGKVFTFVMLMIGLGVIAVPTGLVSSAMTEAIKSEKQGRASSSAWPVADDPPARDDRDSPSDTS